jgi:hypothetical protein
VLAADGLEDFKARARHGDNNAAQRLAGHFAELNQPDEEMRWLRLAANRGDCNAMLLAHDSAAGRGDAREARHWIRQFRSHRCDSSSPVD